MPGLCARSPCVAARRHVASRISLVVVLRPVDLSGRGLAVADPSGAAVITLQQLASTLLPHLAVSQADVVAAFV